MDFFTKLERKFGKFAIPNLTIILIMGFVFGYLISIFSPEALLLISMDPYRIMHGEVYRLLSWVVIPPRGINIFVIIMLMFYYSIGRTLERTMGDFKYTVYVLSGIIFTDLGLMITYFIMKALGQEELIQLYSQYGLYGASTYYLCLSMFLAYALLYPDLQVLLYMIIPIKVKWLAYLDIAYLILTIVQYGYMQYYTGMITVIMSVLNFIVFYLIVKKSTKMSRAHKKRKKRYHQEVRQTQILTRHKCAVCGQTEEDNPDLEFRYCSRCNGNFEYCQNHLFTHTHRR